MLRIKQNSASTFKHQQQYVPLKQVDIQANIRSFAADVTIKQVFRNDETTPIEAVYCFPMEEHAAIYAFIAHIDDRQIIAQLKEKQQAQQDYNHALQQGHGAYLLEQDEKSQDNFIINVGALPPGKECHIQISYVTELDLVQHGTKIRFVVPTTIAPRYNPNQGTLTSPATTTTNYVQSAPYTLTFRCQVEKMDVARVSSLSHPIEVGVGEEEEDVYVIKLSQEHTHLDRDIMIDIELAEHRSNTILAVESNAVMASFTPNQQDCQHAMNDTNEVTNEFIFVVDCSGSMTDENKIGFARQAMLLFLKSLPVNCYFNIIQFGSSYQTLFQDITAIYNKENAQQAEQLTNNMQANLGGTELLLPLQWLDEHSPKEGRARQIFLLTDGEISNVDEVVDLCRSMSTSTRIFSFGLGRSPSRSLVKGLARATNGRFVFIPPDTNVDVYVGEQLEKALQSSITNIHVKWNLGRNVINVPTTLPPVYVNDRLIVYALVNDDSESNGFDPHSSVELSNDKHRLGEAKVNRIPSVSENGTIARLAAKALILELQHSKFSTSNKKNRSRQARFEEQVEEERDKLLNNEKEERKKRISELSLKYHILSPYTAFVGIEKRENGNNDDMILREVPIEISADDQHVERFMTTFSYGASMQCVNSPTKHSSRSSPRLRMRKLFNRELVLDRMSRPTRKYQMSSVPDSESNAMRYCLRDEMQTYNYQSNSALSQVPIPTTSMKQCHSLPTCVSFSDIPYITTSDNSLSSSNIHNAPSFHHKVDDTKSLFLSRKGSSVLSSTSKKQRTEETFPTDDQNIVRYLINKQMFDGLWHLDSKEIEQLTGKPLSHFPQLTDTQLLTSAIVTVLLETRFVSFSSMWYGIVAKARARLLDLLGNDSMKLQQLLEDIRQQL